MKVENVNRPLIKNELLLVPCLVKREEQDEQYKWMELSNRNEKLFILPIINHPHNDVENGQPETHYHLDYRFIKHYNNGNFPSVINTHSKHVYGSELRPTKDFGELVYYKLPVINEEFAGITPVELISKSKFKCARKGKCPHRGYDLSQVKEVNGIKICPLHGLKVRIC